MLTYVRGEGAETLFVTLAHGYVTFPIAAGPNAPPQRAAERPSVWQFKERPAAGRAPCSSEATAARRRPAGVGGAGATVADGCTEPTEGTARRVATATGAHHARRRAKPRERASLWAAATFLRAGVRSGREGGAA